jgi:EpsI family protein
LALLVAGPVLAAGLASPTPPEAIHLDAPAVAGWVGPQAAADAWRPSFNGATGQVRASYRSASGDDVVELLHAVYIGRPRRGHTLITFGNDVYDPARAHILSTADQPVDLADTRKVTARELRLTGAAGSRLVWYWYCVDSRCTRSPVMTKLLQAWDVLRGHVPQSSVWALSSPVVHANADQVRANLRAFARALPASVTPDLPTREQATAENGP